MTRGLVVSIVLLCSLAASAGAQECGDQDGDGSARKAPARDAWDYRRGWIIGGGVTGGSMSFSGADGKAVAVGPVTSFVETAGAVVPKRTLQVIDASAVPPPDTVHVAPFPTSASARAGNLHLGYAFSPRMALLLAGDFVESEETGFGTEVYSLVLRYRLLPRVWVEAGPAGGQINYSFQHGASEEDITGGGFLAAAGVSVLAKPRWTLDVQARYGKIWYDGFQARNLSFGLSVGTVRSGKSPKAGSPAAARPVAPGEPSASTDH